jgi:3-hydroxybutyryl-CoA dehydrogenase
MSRGASRITGVRMLPSTSGYHRRHAAPRPSADNGPGVAESSVTRRMETTVTVVGVAGAGVMGAGVAQCIAQAGHKVIMMDLNWDLLDRARARIERDCRMSRMFGGPAVDVEAVQAMITCAVDPRSLSAAGVVIENITEKLDDKRSLYRELDGICPPETIFIANTSAIPITTLAANTRRPDRVVGVHFMNPVPRKPVVELIPGYHTSAETLERTRRLLADMGKRPIEVKDACGFISNRVLMLTVNEAAYLVHEGVAAPAAVDEVFRESFGHPMGPLETADLIGIDTILYSIEVLHQNLGDSKYRPCPLLRQMTDAGLHGRKTGRGFYPYAVVGEGELGE